MFPALSFVLILAAVAIGLTVLNTKLAKPRRQGIRLTDLKAMADPSTPLGRQYARMASQPRARFPEWPE